MRISRLWLSGEVVKCQCQLITETQLPFSISVPTTPRVWKQKNMLVLSRGGHFCSSSSSWEDVQPDILFFFFFGSSPPSQWVQKYTMFLGYIRWIPKRKSQSCLAGAVIWVMWCFLSAPWCCLETLPRTYPAETLPHLSAVICVMLCYHCPHTIWKVFPPLLLRSFVSHTHLCLWNVASCWYRMKIPHLNWELLRFLRARLWRTKPSLFFPLKITALHWRPRPDSQYLHVFGICGLIYWFYTFTATQTLQT